MAYSVAGKPGFVVAPQGLSSALSGGERDAVLAHERAHLSGGHHRIVGACEVLAAVLPRVPLFAAAPAAVGAIVELSADRHAARVTSPAAVRSALAVVSKSPLPRSEEHTSELQSLMRNSYAVFCLKQKKNNNRQTTTH